jgi:hypothetical protein
VGRHHGIVLACAASGCSDVLGFEDLADAQPCFRDTFDDGAIDVDFWEAIGEVAERDGRVHFSLPSATVTNQILTSKVAHDLTGGSIAIDVTKSVNQGGGAQNLLAAILDGERFLFIVASTGKLQFGSATQTGGSVREIAFDPKIVHWRIRHAIDDDTLRFETAVTDDWTSQLTVPTPFPVTDLFVQLEADTFEQELIPAPANPGGAEFDNFGLSSPACR